MNAMAGTAVWFAQHELRLVWRDWLSMITAGRRERLRIVTLGVVAFVVFMHFVAYAVVGPHAEAAIDKQTLLTITTSALLAWMLMISQAMESITRAFYARSDLDLILASPVNSNKLFGVRIATIALGTTLMALPLAAPFIDILIARGGWRWLGAYGLIVAMGAAATALALGLTVALFRVLGARQTRFVAQVVAALIGAAFVIGLQVVAILSYGTISRAALLQSKTLLALAPELDSALWWPARAALGQIVAADRRAGDELCAPCRRGRGRRPAFRQLRHHCRWGRQRERGPFWTECVSQKALAARCTAPQGMDPAAARSMADVADADADAVSGAAGVDAVAWFRSGQQRASARRAGAGHGRGTTCRRARVARDLGRRCAGPRRHGAGAVAVSS